MANSTGPGPAWTAPTSARKRGADTGPSPVDRRKTGSEHHLICDGLGAPLKVITTAGNVNDVTQALALIDGIPPVPGRRGRPRRRPDSFLGDKGQARPGQWRGDQIVAASRTTGHSPLPSHLQPQG
ncbi:transposase [Streptomyces europaeiscabiei]|uniref:transposase n=1 Tax=Streptomyces europaeiscabiei TaxID=146819 RepID=UPI0038D43303